LHRMQHMCVARALSCWEERAATQIHQRDTCEKVLARWLMGALAQAFSSWNDAVDARKADLAEAEHAQVRDRHVKLSASFDLQAQELASSQARVAELYGKASDVEALVHMITHELSNVENELVCAASVTETLTEDFESTRAALKREREQVAALTAEVDTCKEMNSMLVMKRDELEATCEKRERANRKLRHVLETVGLIGKTFESSMTTELSRVESSGGGDVAGTKSPRRAASPGPIRSPRRPQVDGRIEPFAASPIHSPRKHVMGGEKP